MADLKFSNGDIIPQLGLGTWRSEDKLVKEAIIHSIKTGYRHIDCAYIYTNEKPIGEVLHEAFTSGLVKREEMFITSKLWSSFHPPSQVEGAIKNSLADLQLEYLDLYLMHWPFAFKTDDPENADDLISWEEIPYEQTMEALLKLKEKGLAKHIGVSNFSIKKLQKLMDAGLKPEMNQIEVHPFLQQDELIEFCQKNGILVTAYSPLGSRHLMKEGGKSIIQNEVIMAIAEKHKATPAQVILAWGMQRGIAVIPKSTTPSRIDENWGANELTLSDEDMKQIAPLNQNIRNSKGLFAVLPNGVYTYENIWDE